MLCAGFEYSKGNNNFDNELLKLGLVSYNSFAEEKLTDIPLMQELMKVTSLFLIDWCIESYSKDTEREGYYLSFFKTAIDRLEQTDFSKLFL